MDGGGDLRWGHFLFSRAQRPRTGGAGLDPTPMATDTPMGDSYPVEWIAYIAPFRG